MKRILLSACLVVSSAAPSFAAGTIPGISMTQQLDELAHPLIGGKLYLIQAGTTSTPQSCYQDTALTLAYPNPVTLDASGRVPQLFCADGNIKIRLTDKNGAQKLVQDNLLVVGPSGGGGGGGTVDPTTIFKTGAFMQFYGTGNMTGWVRCNGRTVGSASSGSSERANADVQTLFEFLWAADPNLAVSPGRGTSANADWTANKQLTLPDCRGRVVASLDDMGNSAASRLTSTYFGATATVLGATGGAEGKAIVTTNLPPYSPAGSVSGIITSFSSSALSNSSAGSNISPSTLVNGTTAGTPLGVQAWNTVSGTISGTFTGTAQGGTSTPLAVVQPTILATTYLKL
ncbi:hypothetical protein ABIB06_005971 [Bradyrhizobium sp. LB8.2]|uniref:hypothetical protein n=1 Tax=unclassified Bradyrhizobium TaxID=2631580 RepID=UPI0033977EE6